MARGSARTAPVRRTETGQQWSPQRTPEDGGTGQNKSLEPEHQGGRPGERSRGPGHPFPPPNIIIRELSGRCLDSCVLKTQGFSHFLALFCVLGRFWPCLDTAWTLLGQFCHPAWTPFGLATDVPRVLVGFRPSPGSLPLFVHPQGASRRARGPVGCLASIPECTVARQGVTSVPIGAG